MPAFTCSKKKLPLLNESDIITLYLTLEELMFSYELYSLMHILSVLVVAMSLMVTALHIANGGTKQNLKNRKFLSILHGVALVFVLIGGFGMMARRGFQFSTSHWIHIKLLCWLLLGVYPLFLYKKWVPKKFAIYGLFAVLFIAVYTVVFKTF
jgi:uncharacterized membrane protein SirB2